MSDNRDWQADMTLCEKAQRDEGWAKRDMIAQQPQMSIHWLQQYAAEKERADIATAAYETMINQRVSYDDYRSVLKQLEAAEAREKKLKETMQEIFDILGNNPTQFGILSCREYIYNSITSLYPKEA